MQVIMTLDEYNALLNKASRLELENKILKEFLKSKNVNYDQLLQKARKDDLVQKQKEIESELQKFNKSYNTFEMPYIF